ncbi:peptidoglycan recognition protein family protein [Streptomyces purpureus]|uniref:N-acetylmuramoyl-L-alanine amidase n=1 Tax=Streptomyces purpureus TaxID=1951 RepID=A0A918LWD1_9ACTN|nr:N-acetylmuramoyl-L-alanine amidase [Streptomyces purpureus]GGT59425.1 hypothetical protein GCM10014713_61140 [Streptomyces purpureus]
MTSSDTFRLRPSRRSLLTGAFAVGAAGLLPLGAAGSARAAAGPEILGCAGWGARPSRSPVRVLTTAPHKIIVHHTSTPNTTDLSPAAAIDLAHIMQNDQMDVRGWIDTGQHFTISRGAYILEGRHESVSALQGGTRQVESAHAYGQNQVAVGIENEGTYMKVGQPAAQYAALLELCTHICRQYGLRAYQIYGHRDFNATDCPGDRLYAMLPQLRREVAARLGGDPTAPVWPVVRSGDSGRQVVALQHLLVRYGQPVTVDGAFGPATEAAVREVQTVNHATKDGIAGNQVWHQVVVPVRLGDTGAAVSALQTLLATGGVPTAVDGVFGAATETSVTGFQSARQLPADGVVDARTWGRLLE